MSRKKNLRLLLTSGMPDPTSGGLTFRSVSGGHLAQTRDAGRVGAGDVKVVTQRAPTPTEMTDLPFAFRVCKHVKSNAIVYAKGGATVGLSEKDGGTLLSYNVEAQIGGKLAQLGQRLINGAAKKLADEFFANFAKAVQG